MSENSKRYRIYKYYFPTFDIKRAYPHHAWVDEIYITFSVN